MARGLELAADLGGVEELAVVDDRVGAVLRRHRLLAARRCRSRRGGGWRGPPTGRPASSMRKPSPSGPRCARPTPSCEATSCVDRPAVGEQIPAIPHMLSEAPAACASAVPLVTTSDVADGLVPGDSVVAFNDLIAPEGYDSLDSWAGTPPRLRLMCGICGVVRPTRRTSRRWSSSARPARPPRARRARALRRSPRRDRPEPPRDHRPRHRRPADHQRGRHASPSCSTARSTTTASSASELLAGAQSAPRATRR